MKNPIQIKLCIQIFALWIILVLNLKEQLFLKISVPARSEESEVTVHFNIRLHCQDRVTAPQGERVSDLMIMEPPAAFCQEVPSYRIGCGCPIILKFVSL